MNDQQSQIINLCLETLLEVEISILVLGVA